MSDWQYDMLGIAQCIVAFGQIVLVVRMNVLENRVCSTLNFILKSLGRTGRTQSTGEETFSDGETYLLHETDPENSESSGDFAK